MKLKEWLDIEDKTTKEYKAVKEISEWQLKKFGEINYDMEVTKQVFAAHNYLKKFEKRNLKVKKFKIKEKLNKSIKNPDYYFYMEMDSKNEFCDICIIPKFFYDNTGYIRDYTNLEDDGEIEMPGDIYDDKILDLLDKDFIESTGDWTYAVEACDAKKVYKILMKSKLCIYKKLF
jgi:hypothetical protein